MVRLALVLLVCCGLAPPAIAQSASSLINPLGFIAYYESTYNPTGYQHHHLSELCCRHV